MAAHFISSTSISETSMSNLCICFEGRSFQKMYTYFRHVLSSFEYNGYNIVNAAQVMELIGQ